MFPSRPVYDTAYLANSNVIRFCKPSERCFFHRVSVANFGNECWCQFGMRELVALGVSLFRDLVGVIGALIAKEQMCGVDARRIVAAVQDMHTARYFAEMQFPRYAVRVSDCSLTSYNYI
jgi:hypothetical protein